MVFCNKVLIYGADGSGKCHNPYFNRWFSAIRHSPNYGEVCLCHNPYFNRWFSAIIPALASASNPSGHNPYFNRWFSAINNKRVTTR